MHSGTWIISFDAFSHWAMRTSSRRSEKLRRWQRSMVSSMEQTQFKSKFEVYKLLNFKVSAQLRMLTFSSGIWTTLDMSGNLTLLASITTDWLGFMAAWNDTAVERFKERRRFVTVAQFQFSIHTKSRLSLFGGTKKRFTSSKSSSHLTVSCEQLRCRSNASQRSTLWIWWRSLKAATSVHSSQKNWKLGSKRLKFQARSWGRVIRKKTTRWTRMRLIHTTGCKVHKFRFTVELCWLNNLMNK